MAFTFHMRLDRERETEADLALQKRDHFATNCLPTSTMTLGPAIILLLFTPLLQTPAKQEEVPGKIRGDI